MNNPLQSCGQCAFRRSIQPGALGGSSVFTYIGQANGNFWIPCHCHTDYSDPNWKTDTSKPQCAGTAIFRANVGKAPRPGLHSLPPNKDQVFGSYAEFLAHHERISIKAAENFLREVTPDKLSALELSRSGVKHHLIPRR